MQLSMYVKQVIIMLLLRGKPLFLSCLSAIACLVAETKLKPSIFTTLLVHDFSLFYFLNQSDTVSSNLLIKIVRTRTICQPQSCSSQSCGHFALLYIAMRYIMLISSTWKHMLVSYRKCI